MDKIFDYWTSQKRIVDRFTDNYKGFDEVIAANKLSATSWAEAVPAVPTPPWPAEDLRVCSYEGEMESIHEWGAAMVLAASHRISIGGRT